MLGLQRGTVFPWIVVALTTPLAKAQQCPEGQYWCQDRCGTNVDTCCDTPDGQHNLCGPDYSYKCNADFSCTGPDGVTTQPIWKSTNTAKPDQPGSTTETHHSDPTPTSTGTVVIIGEETATLPVVTAPVTVTLLGHTFVLTPPANTDSADHPPTLVIVGTTTATLPPVTKPTTIATIGTTLTLDPQPEQTLTDDLGQVPITPVVVIDGTKTATLSPVSEPTTVTTDGQTITILPEGPATITVGKPATATTSTTPAATDNPRQDPITPVLIIDGTEATTFPPVTEPTTLTTDEQTITLLPDGPATITVGKTSETATVTGKDKPVIVVIGATTITFPPVTQETTVTTESQTFTLMPQWPLTTTVYPSDQDLPKTTETATKTNDGGEVGLLPTFTQWPPVAVIAPVEQEIEEPEPEDDDDDGDSDSAMIPCKLWFFFICIEFPSIIIRGWKITLPPGIYPPSHPESVKGNLPPWPKFTVGPNHVPTFPKQPEPTKCQTKTASLCSETTSFIVSTVDGAVQTVSSTVLAPQCGEVRGCVVADATQTASVTKTDDCETATVTDVVVTCSGTEAKACSTKTQIPKTGCSVTPTTTTVSCTAAPTGGNARRQHGNNFCPLVGEYVVWPRDGTKTDGTGVIYTEMLKLLGDGSKIKVQDTKTLGINFWRVSLEPGQVAKVKSIQNRHQLKYIDDMIENVEGRSQMVYLSKNEQSKERFDDNYYFDVSAGQDIPVYIVDTGAQMDHREFEYIAHKAEFLFVDNDYDGQKHKDDSGTPIGGKCGPVYCNPHGTSMLGPVAGKRLGVSKRAKPYIVRVPRRDEKGGGATPEDYLQGVSLVNDLFTDSSQTVRAILNLSWRYDFGLFKQGVVDGITNEDFEVWTLRLHALITALIQKASLWFLGQEIHFPDTLVYSMFTSSFFHPDWNIPHIYAPGGHTLGPNGNKTTWHRTLLPNRATYKVSQGTSAATAYTSGLAAYFLKLHQLSRLPKDAKGNDPDMSPAGLKKYIINNGWSRVTQVGVGDIIGIWNGAAIPSLEQDGYCPYSLKEAKKLKRRQVEDDDNNDDIPPTATCASGKATDGSRTTTATTSNPTGESPVTGFTCTPETVDKCAPAVICSAPLRNGCRDGKCVCLPPDPTTFSTVTRTTETSNPTGFQCTPETADKCAPAVICSAPLRNGCRDGKCVCLSPDPLPSRTTQTKAPEPTKTEAPKKPPKQPLKLGEWICHDPSIYEGLGHVDEGFLAQYAGFACVGSARPEAVMHPGKEPKTWHTVTNDMPYYFSISWKKDCETTFSSVSPAFPLWGGEDTVHRDVKCANLLYDVWWECKDKNNGRGGYVDAGCLRYEFTTGKRA
ncbi:hypothetical protein AJ79_06955 [Helicocarpus griseus UAMH5409]|uniref:Peptidase S8/S53 domain-containing protein n=1 Tax=Helicocarpus griseus UAMH5409 TaxID=1447875 RepID=A0A2B7X7M1_9EURO|nr:hypothetical protein AJ79_06955 [Helicocarpus griseus UAMH5409]